MLNEHQDKSTGAAEDTPQTAPHADAVQVFGIDIELVLKRTAILWRARRFILICTAVGLSLSVAAAYLIPVKYEATAVLMPPDAVSTANLSATAMLSSKASSALGSMGSSLGSLLGGQASGQFLVAALQTEALEDRMIKRFDLQKVYHLSTLEKTREKLDKRTDVTEDLKSGVITVVVRDREAKRAADMANAYAEELQRLLFDVRVASARQESELLEEPLETAKKELDQSVADLSQFSSKNTTLDPDVQGKAMVDAAAMLQGQLIAAEAELKGLKQLYTADNQRVQEAQAQVAELRAQLNKLGGEDPTTSHPGSSKEMYPSIRKLPLLGAQYLDLYRQMKIREATYETFVTEVETNKFLELDGGPKVQVLSSATPPDKISFPPRGKLIFLGTFTWLVFACGWVLWTAAVDGMDSNDPRRRLALHVIMRFRRRRYTVHGAETLTSVESVQTPKNASTVEEVTLTGGSSRR
jgi:uncharacterized protein involved in exopolysaccharide biosynthesis